MRFWTQGGLWNKALSSVGVRWLLTHIARSSGLGSGCRAPGGDPSSPNPPPYVGTGQGSLAPFFFFFFKLSQGGVTRGQAHTGRPPWFPQCPLPSRPPFPASLSPRTHVRHPGPRPPPLWPPFPFPLLSDGYGQGLSSDRELRLHQGGLPALRGCGLPADSTTPPPEACRPPASARRTERARAPAGAGKPGSPGAWEVAGELGSWEESV